MAYNPNDYVCPASVYEWFATRHTYDEMLELATTDECLSVGKLADLWWGNLPLAKQQAFLEE